MKEILFPAAAPSVTAERKPGKMELKASQEDDDSIGGSARHSSFSHSIACAGPGQQPGGPLPRVRRPAPSNLRRLVVPFHRGVLGHSMRADTLFTRRRDVFGTGLLHNIFGPGHFVGSIAMNRQ